MMINRREREVVRLRTRPELRGFSPINWEIVTTKVHQNKDVMMFVRFMTIQLMVKNITYLKRDRKELLF